MSGSPLTSDERHQMRINSDSGGFLPDMSFDPSFRSEELSIITEDSLVHVDRGDGEEDDLSRIDVNRRDHFTGARFDGSGERDVVVECR